MPLKKCKRLCDYLIWGSTTLSHWALPGGSSLGNTKIIENTKMVKEMRQSTRTHTYTHARLMKSKRNIYKKSVQKKTSDPNQRSPEKGGKENEKEQKDSTREVSILFFFFQSARTSTNHCCCVGRGKKNKAKLCIFCFPGGNLVLGLSKQGNTSKRNQEREKLTISCIIGSQAGWLYV